MSHPDKPDQNNLYRSPSRKLITWLWSQTPAGRAEARRELLQQVAVEQSRIEERDRHVRQLLEQVNTPQDFQETFDELTVRRIALSQSEHLAELRALRSAYDSWLTDIDDLISTRETQQARAASARSQLTRLHSHLQPTENLPSDRNKALSQLARLETRLAELDASEAKLALHWHTAHDRQVWLHQLGTAYRSLEAETLALGKATCPEVYTAE